MVDTAVELVEDPGRGAFDKRTGAQDEIVVIEQRVAALVILIAVDQRGRDGNDCRRRLGGQDGTALLKHGQHPRRLGLHHVRYFRHRRTGRLAGKRRPD
ncbi:MAG: hypothetical protein QMB76_03205, partial [Alphaproteobacteria bacterium]